MTTFRHAGLLSGLVAACALVVSGCGGTESADAPDTTRSAATATTAPTPTAGTTTATTTAQTTPTKPGAATAGKAVFETKCSGCHAGGGTRAAFGPKLSGKNLTVAVIRATIENGRGQMPAGRAQGQDLADVVAYVLSLQ